MLARSINQRGSRNKHPQFHKLYIEETSYSFSIETINHRLLKQRHEKNRFGERHLWEQIP